MIVSIIQARLGSNRLHGKVLKMIKDKTMLQHVYERTKRANLLDNVVIATTFLAEDDVIVERCKTMNAPYYRGDIDDVLGRYLETANEYNASTIVRVTSDCPLIDPDIINAVVKYFRDNDYDYVSNINPDRTYPRGLDVEVASYKALKIAFDNDRTYRVHVMPYIWKNPKKFKIACIKNDIDYSSKRWTVDTKEDLKLVREIYKHFPDNRFSWREVINLCDKYPELENINKGVLQKPL